VAFEEESEVTTQVVLFYKNLYQESEGWRPFAEGLEFGDMERVWLERKFEREDIFQVVRLGRGQSSRSGWFYYGLLLSLLESSREQRLSGL